jgi:hypothetical protein
MNAFLLVSVVNFDISHNIFASKEEAREEMARRFAKAENIPESRIPDLLHGNAADELEGGEFAENYATTTQDGTNYDWHIFDISEDVANIVYGMPEAKWNATFTSLWDGGTEITAPCRVDKIAHTIEDIEAAECSDSVDVLEREYVTVDGQEFPAFPADDTDAILDFQEEHPDQILYTYD